MKDPPTPLAAAEKAARQVLADFSHDATERHNVTRHLKHSLESMRGVQVTVHSFAKTWKGKAAEVKALAKAQKLTVADAKAVLSELHLALVPLDAKAVSAKERVQTGVTSSVHLLSRMSTKTQAALWAASHSKELNKTTAMRSKALGRESQVEPLRWVQPIVASVCASLPLARRSCCC